MSHDPNKSSSSWWLNQPIWKIWVKLDIFSNFWGELFLENNIWVATGPSHFSVIQKFVTLVSLESVGSCELAPTGWYRWWFRNPHFAIVWMCSIKPVVNHGICFTRLDGSSKTDLSVNKSSSSIAAPVIWSHARRFEGSFSWWPEQDIQDGHLYQCGYRANTCMIMCRNYIDTHIYIYTYWNINIYTDIYIYIYILNPHYIFTQIKQTEIWLHFDTKLY